MPPIILVTTDRRDGVPAADGPRVRPRPSEAWISEGYVAAVRRAGGLPLLVPPGDEDVQALLTIADGLVLTGGHFDIHPSWYGGTVTGRLDRVEPARTALELTLARAALVRGVPVLGICGGMQALAVAAGGTLVQDIATGIEGALEHEQPTAPSEPWHPVHLEDPAARWLGAEVQVNSTHHQAVAAPGAGLRACGWAPDGVIEVIASADDRFALGVQWHPEALGDDRVYRALIEACARG